MLWAQGVGSEGWPGVRARSSGTVGTAAAVSLCDPQQGGTRSVPYQDRRQGR